MPTASGVAPGAQKCLHNANVRIVRGFSCLSGVGTVLAGLEGRRTRTCALGCNVLRSESVAGLKLQRGGTWIVTVG